jgi:glycosyltransferase involved in cell wall biosynthesis
MAKFLICTSPRGRSGTDYLFALGYTLNDLGHEVTIITDQNKPQLLPLNKTRLYFYSWPSKRPTKLLDFLFLKEICKKHQPECAIGTFGSTNIILIGGYILGIKHRIAFLRTIQQKAFEAERKSNIIRPYFLKWRKKIILRLFSTALIANSEALKEHIINIYNIGHKKILVFHLIISDDYNSDTIVGNEGQSIVSFVGRLSKLKGQDILIRESVDLSKKIPNIKFIIVGKGDQEQSLKDLVERMSLKDIFEFTGALPKHEVMKIMKKSKVHVSASAEEAFGLVNIEALSVGTPIVAPNVGGIKEILQDGYNGFFYDPEKKGDLCRVILKLINDEWGTFSANARKSYIENFSPQKYKDQALELIRLVENE